ncbi:hypothetical protein GIB67_024972 [Kingdonia uniflora]|uniref:Myb-like domain-containing protein n=1 Tax=Kingdonia uniflora TaxID=39325 RepID=A0A7J7NZ37_9MAGN|nr:hypothetical protein GIB67_024972 [Kingdonia uniflora]
MSNQGASSSNMLRDYSKGNWTIQETMILIGAKKFEEERRMKRSSGPSGDNIKPAELRWKRVEDYCWSNGCLRSQNQCNDKWDNLMRDYKKIRDYERRLIGENNGDGVDQGISYWRLEKLDRKNRDLPSNMLPQIYEALVDVVERRDIVHKISGGVSSSIMGILVPHHTSIPTPPLPLPLPLPPQAPAPSTLEMCDSSDSDQSNSSAKRRKRGDHGKGKTSSQPSNDVSCAISESATTIAKALQSCDEQEERRHREIMSLQERKLKIMESKIGSDREAFSGIVDSINNLSNSIFALVSYKNPIAPK